MLRFITAGESHGPVLTTIIEGLPAGLPVSVEKINQMLARRQGGYGRGNRMKIETDQIQLTSGVRHGLTLGSPVTMSLPNKDFKNWQSVMGIEPVEDPRAKLRRAVHRPRPGHADLVGGLKYHHEDLRNVLERSSARETAMRVALGSVASQLLEGLGVEVAAYVREIGGIVGEAPVGDLSLSALRERVATSPVMMVDAEKEAAVIAKIDETKKAGNTLGGVVEVIATGLPIGLGSYTQWDKKLDGRLVQALVSINAFKGAEIGDGFELARRFGSEVMDEIAYQPERGFYRLSNHLGGIEGGMTNGMPVIVRGVKKPIPTLYRPLQSVDIYTKEPYDASIERSDTTAVPAASVVAEAVVALELAQAVLEKFPHDSYGELVAAVAAHREYSKNPDMWQQVDTDEEGAGKVPAVENTDWAAQADAKAEAESAGSGGDGGSVGNGGRVGSGEDGGRVESLMRDDNVGDSERAGSLNGAESLGSIERAERLNGLDSSESSEGLKELENIEGAERLNGLDNSESSERLKRTESLADPLEARQSNRANQTNPHQASSKQITDDKES